MTEARRDTPPAPRPVHRPATGAEDRRDPAAARVRRHVRRGNHRTVPALLLRPIRRPGNRLPTSCPCWPNASPANACTALARVEGKIVDGKPTVLFLCTHNAGRSQMALGFFTHLAGDNAVAWSGGSEPGNEINPAAVEAMAEVGIDITGEYPKPWTDEIVQAADVVITMGCGDACPVFPGKTLRGMGPRRPRRPGLERSARSATTSKNASADCSPNSTSPPPRERSRYFERHCPHDIVQAQRAVRVRAQRRTLPDGGRVPHRPRRGPRRGPIGRQYTCRRDLRRRRGRAERAASSAATAAPIPEEPPVTMACEFSLQPATIQPATIQPDPAQV